MVTQENNATSNTWIQKDYSKLENIFNAAVEKSKQRKIIPYGSKRLYSKEGLLKMTAEMFKKNPQALPIEIWDVKTEVVDLKNPKPVQAETTPEEPKKTEALEEAATAVEAAIEVVPQAREETPPVEVPEETPAEIEAKAVEVVPQTAPAIPEPVPEEKAPETGEEASLMDRYNELKTKSRESTAPEAGKANSELITTSLALFVSIFAVLIYTGFTFSSFTGYDYIGLILCVIAVFVAWDLTMKRNLILCVVLLATLIVCMMVSVYQTQTPVGYIHYLWFFLIPLCMSTSYAFIVSYRSYRNSKESLR